MEEMRLENDYLWGYEDKFDVVMYGEKDALKMGVELEIDKGSNVEDCVYEMSILSGKHCCKYDGSLDDGIEIVTQPMSLSYHMNDFPWFDIIKVADKFKFKSDQAGTCGLHVHVNRDYFYSDEIAACKIMYLFNKYKYEFIKFSRRFSSQKRWCEIDDITDITLDNYYAIQENRYKAINALNENTLEFRLWKGSMNLETLFASLQMTQVLCDIANKISIREIKELSWKDICEYGREYRELQLYLQRRNLLVTSNKIA